MVKFASSFVRTFTFSIVSSTGSFSTVACTVGNSVFPSFQPEQHYAIVHSGDGQLLGDLSVFFSPDDRCFTLGITVSPGFQRQGYAFEVLGSVVEKLEQFDPTADIVALIEKGNDPSLALFQKLDFVEECYAQSIASYVYVRYAKEK